MHDIMVIAGVRTNNQRKAGANSFSRYHKPPVVEAQQICDELINRNFANIDSSINNLSQYRFSPSLVADVPFKSYKPEAIAKAIVYTAELLNLYWDDTIRTPYEIDEFKKTILGDAVYKYGRYISAVPDPKATKTRTPKAAANSSNTSSAGGSSSGSKGKPVGPQSANIRDLRDISGGPGTPGQKVTASGDVMYRIIGDKGTGKNTPNAFVNPLSRSGASGNTNKVKFSSGNGWTDCTCMFDDPNDANDFLTKLLANDQDAVNANARIVKFNADPNGYFLVGTEYGMCAISARKMNEALAEAAKMEESCGGWEKATEGYDKAKLAELHDWMRRD
jgi:hypothetical protein